MCLRNKAKRKKRNFLLGGLFFILLLATTSQGLCVAAPSSSSPEISVPPDPLWIQGKVLCEAGEYKKSLRFLTDLLVHTEKEGERAIILFWMGKAWEGMGDFDRAQESYVAALRENPGLPELSRILAVHQGQATPLWDHVPSPGEPLSLPKASKPPFQEYTVVQPPILPAPVLSVPPAPAPMPPQGSPAPFSPPLPPGNSAPSFLNPQALPAREVQGIPRAVLPNSAMPQEYTALQGSCGETPPFLSASPPVESPFPMGTGASFSAPAPVYNPPFPGKTETLNAAQSPLSPGNLTVNTITKMDALSPNPGTTPIYLPPPPEEPAPFSEDVLPQKESQKPEEKPVYIPPAPPKEEENVVP